MTSVKRSAFLSRSDRATLRGLLHAKLMHNLDQRFRVFRRDIGGDAVAKVENVAGAMLGGGQHLQGFAADRGDVGQQDDRVEIALDGNVVTDRLPAVAQIDSPIEPAVRARFSSRMVPLPSRSAAMLITAAG